jgi:altronate dehydratase small subunit
MYTVINRRQRQELEMGRPNMKKAIVLDTKDNVATLLSDVDKNDVVQARTGQEVTTLRVKEKIPFGHKFAVKKIVRGENVIKYGEVIGQATCDIEEGSHAHVHNVESLRGRGDLH